MACHLIRRLRLNVLPPAEDSTRIACPDALQTPISPNPQITEQDFFFTAKSRNKTKTVPPNDSRRLRIYERNTWIGRGPQRLQRPLLTCPLRGARRAGSSTPTRRGTGRGGRGKSGLSYGGEILPLKPHCWLEIPCAGRRLVLVCLYYLLLPICSSGNELLLPRATN